MVRSECKKRGTDRGELDSERCGKRKGVETKEAVREGVAGQSWAGQEDDHRQVRRTLSVAAQVPTSAPTVREKAPWGLGGCAGACAGCIGPSLNCSGWVQGGRTARFGAQWSGLG